MTQKALKRRKCFTNSKDTRVNDICEEESESASDCLFVGYVRKYNGDASDQADAAMNNHTQTSKEHCSKAIPVTSWISRNALSEDIL